jgi:hypothetical protein
MSRIIRTYRSKRGRLIFTPIVIPFLAVALTLLNHHLSRRHQSWGSAALDAAGATIVFTVVMLVGTTWIFPAIQRRQEPRDESGPHF